MFFLVGMIMKIRIRAILILLRKFNYVFLFSGLQKVLGESLP